MSDFRPTSGSRSWSGWWFGTFVTFRYIRKNHPNWRVLVFFRGVAQPPNLWSRQVTTPSSTGFQQQNQSNNSIDIDDNDSHHVLIRSCNSELVEQQYVLYSEHKLLWNNNVGSTGHTWRRASNARLVPGVTKFSGLDHAFILLDWYFSDRFLASTGNPVEISPRCPFASTVADGCWDLLKKGGQALKTAVPFFWCCWLRIWDRWLIPLGFPWNLQSFVEKIPIGMPTGARLRNPPQYDGIFNEVMTKNQQRTDPKQ